jgi:hypothetical protein
MWKDSLSKVNCSAWHGYRGSEKTMNADTNYSMWHCYQGSGNADDCREMKHSLRTEIRLKCIMQQDVPRVCISWFYYRRLHNIMNQFVPPPHAKVMFFNELGVKDYIWWQRNQSYFIWIWVVYLWKNILLAFNNIFYVIYKLTNSYWNLRRLDCGLWWFCMKHLH